MFFFNFNFGNFYFKFIVWTVVYRTCRLWGPYCQYLTRLLYRISQFVRTNEYLINSSHRFGIRTVTRVPYQSVCINCIEFSKTVLFLFTALESGLCSGSVTSWYGSGCVSGSSNLYHWLTDPDADRNQNLQWLLGCSKNKFFVFFLCFEKGNLKDSKLYKCVWWLKINL